MLVLDSSGLPPPSPVITVVPGSDRTTFELGCSGCSPTQTLLWDFVDAGAVGASVSRTFVPARERVRLRAVDPATGLTGYDSVMVEVDDAKGLAPPDCHAYVSPGAAQVPPDVRFTFFADGLFNATGGISQANYAFADGGQALDMDPHQIRSTPGIERGELTAVAGSLACVDEVYGVALTNLKGDAPPRIDPIPVPPAICGVAYMFMPLVEGSRPLTFTATTPLPDGAMLDGKTGTLQWTPPLGMRTPYVLGLHVTNSAGVDDGTVTIPVACVNGLDFQTCGCGSTLLGPAALLVLAGLWRRRSARLNRS